MVSSVALVAPTIQFGDAPDVTRGNAKKRVFLTLPKTRTALSHALKFWQVTLLCPAVIARDLAQGAFLS